MDDPDEEDSRAVDFVKCISEYHIAHGTDEEIQVAFGSYRASDTQPERSIWWQGNISLYQ